MAARPSKELPANYSRFWQFDLTRVQDLFWLNLAGILLFFAAALVFAFLGYWLRPQVFSLQTLFAPAPAWQLLLFLGEVLAGLMYMGIGAALYAARTIAQEIESGVIVTIFPDRGEKYLSTDLFRV